MTLFPISSGLSAFFVDSFISTYGIAYGAAIFLDTRYKIQSYCKSNFRVVIASLIRAVRGFFPLHTLG